MAKRSSVRNRTNNKKSRLSGRKSYKKRQSGSGILDKFRKKKGLEKKNKEISPVSSLKKPGLWKKLKNSFKKKDKVKEEIKSPTSNETSQTTNDNSSPNLDTKNNSSKLSKEEEIERKRNKYLGLGAILTKKDGTRRTVKEMLGNWNELAKTPEGEEFIKNLNSVSSQYQSGPIEKSTNYEENQREDELNKETNIKSVEKIIEKLQNVKTYDEFKAFLESHSPVFKEFRKAVKQKLESLIKNGEITSVEQINYLGQEKKFISKKSAVKSLEEIRKKIDEQIKLQTPQQV